MTIDPRVGFYLGIATAILLFTAGATTELTTIFNAVIAAKITAGAVFLGGIMAAITGILHAIPSGNTPADLQKFMLGPSSPPLTMPPVTKAIVLLAILILGALIIPTVGYAQTPRPRPHITGNPIEDIKADVQDLNGNVTATANGILAKQTADVTKFLTDLADISGAITLSTQIPGLQDPVGNACWLQFNGIGELLKAHPLPATFKVASDWEALRLLAIGLNQVCANPNCGQMFVDATNTVSAIAPVPSGISLQSLCSKVPVIGTSAVPTAAAPTNGIGTVSTPVPAPALPAPPPKP